MTAQGAHTRFPRGLYGVTPEWEDTPSLLDAVTRAAQGGMTALQWRRKTGDPAQRMEQALQLAQLCKQLGVVFIVNDSIEMALRVGADGAHLGRDDGPLDQARQALGPGKILGCSCYDQPELARQGLAAGADYVAFGALYPSSVKPGAVRATLDHLRRGRALAEQAGAGLPRRPAVVAIGGLTADNAAPVVRAGADSLALISGLFQADDIQAAARRCSALFG